MVESISMDVHAQVPINILSRALRGVDEKYAQRLLGRYDMNAGQDAKDIAKPYASLPTQDLTLRVYQSAKGLSFFTTASGSFRRPERTSVQYLVLRRIQRELKNAGYPSEIDTSDLNPETISFMKRKGILTHNKTSG